MMKIKQDFSILKKDNSIIEVVDLTKKFDDITAVDNISFNIKRGELFGFLGPNGAGKTTTINMLTGLARVDSGSIRIDGFNCSKDPKAAQHLIGIVPDESNLYPELTGFENLCFCASLYGMKKVKREEQAKKLLEQFGLSEVSDKKFAAYSKGMKRKLTIAAGIIHDPKILFLDEPTTGIDVASARQIRNMILKLHSNGTTIFLTTHYIEEAERLCERIAFIVRGKIVLVKSVKDLLMPVLRKNIMMISFSNISENLIKKFSKKFIDFNFEQVSSDIIRIESTKPIDLGLFFDFAKVNGMKITEARRANPSLEDVFVEITGIEADIMRKEQVKRKERV